MTLSDRARMRLVEAHRIGHMREVAALLRRSFRYRGTDVLLLQDLAAPPARTSALTQLLRFARLRKVA